VPPGELDQLVEGIHANSRGESRQATGNAASNLDLYQVNCTYYDALARNDLAYLLARAVQLFLPGIPQIYYVGLLAGGNDMTLLAESGVGRDINRHRYAPGEAEAELARPVVRELLALIRRRNECPAFRGYFRSEASAAESLSLRWTHGNDEARLAVNFRTLDYDLLFSLDGVEQAVRFDLGQSGSSLQRVAVATAPRSASTGDPAIEAH
jgi:sucrose phosphorylase